MPPHSWLLLHKRVFKFLIVELGMACQGVPYFKMEVIKNTKHIYLSPPYNLRTIGSFVIILLPEDSECIAAAATNLILESEK